MKTFLLRRLLLTIPAFLGISLITFLLIQSVPGSPIYMRLRAAEGDARSAAATQEIIEQTKRLYGLDKPIPVQYGLWLGRLSRLDFGNSYKDQRPVLDKILEALPITLQLSILSILLTYIIAIPIGVFSAVRQRSLADYIITLILFILYSLPSFWVAMLLILLLGEGGWLAWLPIYGASSTGAEGWPWHEQLLDRLRHLALPLICYTYGSLAAVSRFMRTGMLDVIRQDYIRTARAYGFSEKTIVLKYALRNALIPILTLAGTLLPALIGGSVIIESIFSLPGMGRLMWDAMLSRDYPLIMGIVTFSGILTLAGLILSDLLYALADPRIRLEQR